MIHYLFIVKVKQNVLTLIVTTYWIELIVAHNFKIRDQLKHECR